MAVAAAEVTGKLRTASPAAIASEQAQAMATLHRFAANGAIQQASVQAGMPDDWQNNAKAALQVLQAASAQVLDDTTGGPPRVPLATGHRPPGTEEAAARLKEAAREAPDFGGGPPT